MGYEIAVFVTWIAAIWAICSVTFTPSSQFHALGQSKGKWLLIAVLSAIPYLGLIASGAYLFMVRLRFAPKERGPGYVPARGPVPTSGPGSPHYIERVGPGRVLDESTGSV